MEKTLSELIEYLLKRVKELELEIKDMKEYIGNISFSNTMYKDENKRIKENMDLVKILFDLLSITIESPNRVNFNALNVSLLKYDFPEIYDLLIEIINMLNDRVHNEI